MRVIIATILASTLLVYSAIAAGAPSQSPGLSPGKAAGVKQANVEADGVMLWSGVPALAAGIAVIVSQPEAAATLPPPPAGNPLAA